MEENILFKQVVHNIKQLEQRLATVDDGAFEKYAKEAEEEIDEHFAECLNALAARKEALLQDLKQKIQDQKILSTNSRKELRVAINMRMKMLEAGSMGYDFDVTTAETIWKGVENLPDPQGVTGRVALDLPDSLLQFISAHGQVTAARPPTASNFTVANSVTRVVGANHHKDGKQFDFGGIYGICWNPIDECVYICDHGSSIIRKMTKQGEVSTVLQANGLNHPHGLVVNYKTNDVIFTNQYANTILKLSAMGQLSTIAGLQDGTDAITFSNPNGLAIDQQTGNIYVADFSNSLLKKITPQGIALTGSTAGYRDGLGTEAQFNGPWGLCFDEIDQSVLVCDFHNNKLRRVKRTGAVSTVATVPSPSFVTVAGKGYLVSSQHRIYVVTREGQVSVLMDSTNSELKVATPRGIAVHEASNSCFVVTDDGKAITKIHFA